MEQTEESLQAEVERLTAELAELEADTEHHRQALLEVNEEVEGLEQATPEAVERHTASCPHSSKSSNRRYGLGPLRRVPSGRRKAPDRTRALKAAWSELKAAGYQVQGDKVNPVVLGKAVDALKSTHDYSFSRRHPRRIRSRIIPSGSSGRTARTDGSRV